jgi:predicted O-linked N-acetylglucosamine transferase (SPINDLY family)
MAISPDPVGRASALVDQGRLPEAREALRHVLAEMPAHAEALHLAGIVELLDGSPAAAVPLLRRCVEVAPKVAFAWSNLGVALTGMGDCSNALECFSRTLELEPRNAGAMKNMGIALRRLRRFDEAMASFRRAAQREPNDAELHREVGDLLTDMGRPAEALSRYDRALAANPRDAIAHHNRGYAAWRSGDPERAERDLRRAIEAAPRFARAYSTLGALLVELGRAEEAVRLHEQAVAIEPGNASFHNEHGIALEALGRREDGIACYDRALELQPAFTRALENRGAARYELKRLDEALADYERAEELAPDEYCGDLLHLRLDLCDWKGFDELVARLARGGGDSRGWSAARLFPAYFVGLSPAAQRAVAEKLSADLLATTPARPWSGPTRHSRPLRVGYFSADMREHPVGHVLAPLVERHDPTRVEAIAFSFGPAGRDPVRARLEGAFHRFIDVRGEGAAAIAARARSLGLDVAVDLMGHTKGARPAIFAHRAAPVQAQYLGLAGTMGAPFIDYLVADRTVVPEASVANYTEKLAWVRGVALVGDPDRAIAAPPSRAEAGLPETGTVFCCFCKNTKITPDAFASWMRILSAVEGSVLWLARPGDTPMRNLRAEAERRGIAPGRLLFAPRVERLADHLARIALADLFLDTFHYTGHVTASDALFAGLPLVTLLGDAFPARVSASLLGAVGLPELVTRSAAEYEALAVALARDPERLRQHRERLARARASSPAFDPASLARDLEDLYERMAERQRAGLPPQHIRLEAS